MHRWSSSCLQGLRELKLLMQTSSQLEAFSKTRRRNSIVSHRKTTNFLSLTYQNTRLRPLSHKTNLIKKVPPKPLLSLIWGLLVPFPNRNVTFSCQAPLSKPLTSSSIWPRHIRTPFSKPMHLKKTSAAPASHRHAKYSKKTITSNYTRQTQTTVFWISLAVLRSI